MIFLFALQNLHKRHFLGHSDQYLLSADRAVAFHKACFRLGITDTHEMYWTSFQIGIAPLPTDVHMSMFIPTLETQSSPAQRRYWVPLARNFAILVCALEPTPPCLPSAVPLSDLRPDYSLQGAYAQTELGHGSNVRGIETMATYDPATQSFDLHSPTEASTKWWPGGLGKTATHAVVYARLLLKGRDMGLHAFIVELRDPATHRSLPGIELGDIGPKLGFNTVDNGYARFSPARAPAPGLLLAHACGRVRPCRRREAWIRVHAACQVAPNALPACCGVCGAIALPSACARGGLVMFLTARPRNKPPGRTSSSDPPPR